MDYEEEKANTLFSIFCYGFLFAMTLGMLIGSLITYFIIK